MNIEELEFEALQAEKRDKMNSRWQVWSILVGLVGAFGLASLQTGATGYVVGLFPLVAACLARFSAHSESVLDQIKDYLLVVERKHNYEGYESYNKATKRKSSGGHTKALRDAILIADALALAATIIHLLSDHLPAWVGVGLFVEVGAAWLTAQWLRD